MNKITTILLSLFLIVSVVLAQNDKIGEMLPDAKLKQIKSGVFVDYDLLKQTKAKVTIIEFWETWCGPCIDGMFHLQQLKNKFPDVLNVICVSSDDIDKTQAFISKNKFSFDFIYDKEKQLKNRFPHSSIPHTILIDKTGKIVARTYPGYLTEATIKELVSDGQVSLPVVKNFNPDEMNMNLDGNSMLKFEIFSSELGDRDYMNHSSMMVKKNIVNNYSGNVSYDTIHTINSFNMSGKNILNLYSFAYNNHPATRFLYNPELVFIKSFMPNHLYRVNFSCSSLLGDYHKVLVKQLDAVFGLKTSVVENIVDVLVLTSVDTTLNTIKKSKGAESATTKFQHSYKDFNLSADDINTVNLAVNLEAKMQIPVDNLLPAADRYEIKINIENESMEIDTWIDLFRKNGIIISKEKRKMKFVKIER